MSSKLKPFLLLALPILLTLALSYYLQYTILADKQTFLNWLQSFGPYIIVVYIIVQSVTIIIAPLGGFFIVLAMIALFGPGPALAMAYLISTPCYLLNFFLARRYGRPLVQRILGEDTIRKMDEFVKDEGLVTLILTRLFQGGYFDYLSYGWGLTKIPFKSFLIVNILAGIPATLIIYLAFRETSNLTTGIIAFYIITTALTVISVLFIRKMKKVV